MGFEFASLTLLLFLDPILEFLKILQRQGSSDGFLDHSGGICYLTKGFKRAPTSYSTACMWSFG
jgi:hypothetical protein